MLRKFIKFCFWVLFLICAVGLVVGGTALFWGYLYITRDLPQLQTIEDYKPPLVSRVYDRNGILIGEFYKERRYQVKLTKVPEKVREAFLAAEDASFYHHPGIDLISIGRALIKNFKAGGTKQGASTITQQVVKNLLLTPKQDYERKIKEAILAYRLEKRLSKDEIFEIYLNQMFFGNTAYGLKAAAKVYFHKDTADLSLAEGAMLAGLLKAPSRYSPVHQFSRAKRRQKYVLTQMRKAGFITQAEEQEALMEPLTVFQGIHRKTIAAPYYVEEVRRRIGKIVPDADKGGYTIHTALDTNAYEMARRALRKGLREVDRRKGWRGPLGFVEKDKREEYLKQLNERLPDVLEADYPYPALVEKVDKARQRIRVNLARFSGMVNLKGAKWAKKRLEEEDKISWRKLAGDLKPGDVIEVSFKGSNDKSAISEAESSAEGFKPPGLFFDQTPELEGALVLLNPTSGQVVTVNGGYDYRRYNFKENRFKRNEFNRVTQAKRQPGSAFKPVVYLAAIDAFGYTPATIVNDAPRSFRVGDDYWVPANYDKKYLGPITLRTALQRSRNLVSADIISRIGVQAVVDYASKLGIKSRLERVLSLSLGSSEVDLLEMARAYGVFAARGVLFPSVFVEKIEDRGGRVVYDYSNNLLASARQVINERSAFIMANMMKGVVEHGTGYRVKPIGRPVAGKTGTSNDLMDAWFIGYTPDWVCGVWSGFDLKRKIGDRETGGRVAAPIWLYFMQEFLKYDDELKLRKLKKESEAEAERLGIEIEPVKLEPLDFQIPDGVDPYWVDKNTGLLSSPENENAIYEYFISGTEPKEKHSVEPTIEKYLESPDL